jgi:hypothetical protein
VCGRDIRSLVEDVASPRAPLHRSLIESVLTARAPQWLQQNAAIAGVLRRSLTSWTREVKSFIFTATTGRSGTLTLSELFATIPRCAAFHEPHPSMNGDVLIAASNGNTALVDRVYDRVKSINILRAAIGQRHYLEANHLFVKTFIGHAAAQFGDRMAVVHLVRSPVEVAMSIYHLQNLPGSDAGNIWWGDYHAPTNVLQMADQLERDPDLSHPFYRGLWYWYECELRFAAWRARLPALRVVRFETPWFNDEAKIRALLDQLDVPYGPDKIASFVGRRLHTKDAHKTAPLLPRTDAELMHERFRRVLEARGLDVSALACA